MGRPLPWQYWRVFLVERGWPIEYVDSLGYEEATELITTIQATERGYAHNLRRERQHAAATARKGRR